MNPASLIREAGKGHEESASPATAQMMQRLHVLGVVVRAEITNSLQKFISRDMDLCPDDDN